MKKLSIAVVGAGFAGSSFSLFAKKLLSKKYKLDLTLFERVQNPSPVGAGILIQPIGLYCLHQYNPNLSRKIRDLGCKVDNLYAVTKNGKIVMDLHYSKLHKDIHGIGLQRGTLFSELKNYIHQENINMLTGKNVVSVETKDGQNYLKDSESKEYGPFDLVVIADGQKSSLRNSLKGEEFPVKHHHYKWGALWTLIPDHPERPLKNTLYQALSKCDIMLGYLPSGKSDTDSSSKVSIFWSIHERDYVKWKNNEITLEDLKSSIKDLDPYMSQYILDYITSKDQLNFADYSDVRMENVGKRNIIFIGDSAHATSPVLGQGTNLALYDTLSLSQHLLDYELNDALKNFSKERKEHVLFYLRASKILNPVFQSDHIPGLSFLRDNFTPLMLKIPFFYKQGLMTQSGVKTGCNDFNYS